MTFADADKFVVSYSGGKDGVLALFRAVRSGMKPIGAITTFDRENERSWFHRLPEKLLRKVEESLEIPFEIIDTLGDRYAGDFETTLKSFKSRGADAAVFGDIDIREHYDWCDARCQAAGLESVFPLWREDRKKVVDEVIDLGFQAIITIVDTSKMSETFLGKTLTGETVSRLAAEGADACGENGEYHTFVYGGPLFRRNVEFNIEGTVKAGAYSCLLLR